MNSARESREESSSPDDACKAHDPGIALPSAILCDALIEKQAGVEQKDDGKDDAESLDWFIWIE